MPFSRQQRALVYQRAKNAMDVVPFGTEHDVYDVAYEWINHSIVPSFIDSHDFRVRVGSQATQPYDASVFNISAMSFGALSANAVRALNAGARRGGFYHDTGEGSISAYHRENGGDLIWEIGSGYFGCRNRDGSFNPEEFLAKVDGGRTISNYRKNETGFSQGDAADSVFYIHKGKVKVTVVSEHGKEAVVAILGKDEFCGEGCLAGQPRPAIDARDRRACASGSTR